MFCRNMLTKIIDKVFFANRAFVRVVDFEFGGISAPGRAQIVPNRFFLCSVCPDSTVELG